MSFVINPIAEQAPLCPVLTLKNYMEMSKPLRKSDSSKSRLFLSYIKPHQPVTPVTVARWLLTIMCLAGIDVGKYKAHSARGAAAAHALKSGMSVQEVLKSGHWKRQSTFQKYYERKVQGHRSFKRIYCKNHFPPKCNGYLY